MTDIDVLLPGGAIRSERRVAGNRGQALAKQVDLEFRTGVDETPRQVRQRYWPFSSSTASVQPRRARYGIKGGR
jgi:hypothetical protein